jgi:hypothetical protein
VRRPQPPEDIFTPKAVVSPELFERRNEPDQLGNAGLQDLVIEGLREKGAQLRVFGDTGVGKTSLVVFAAEEAGLNRLVVECMGTHDYADLIHTAITKMQGVKLKSFTKTVSSDAALEASGGLKYLASIKGTLKMSGGRTRQFEIVDQAPLDLLLRLMKDADYQILVLDNFQNIGATETRTYVAQTMEVLADRADETGGIKIVVIGIAQDAKSLLGQSGSFRRRTTDIGVPRMPDVEIRSILTTGFHLLDLGIDRKILDHLVYFSDGYPFFAHLIGLNVARTARRDDKPTVNQSVVARALLRCTREVDETYAARVRLAEETGGKTQPKRRILAILAASTARSWTSNEVKTLWIEEFERGSRRDGTIREQLGFVNVALGGLITPKSGGILTRDESRRPYVYRFADPHFRPFLRLRHQSGLEP